MTSEKQRLQAPFTSRLAGTALWAFLLIWWGVLLILSPLLLGYGLLLLTSVRFDWHGKGKDVLVVRSGKSKFKNPLEEIQPVVEKRSEFLDWDDRSKWPMWSVAPRLFRLYAFFYGPQPFARELSLPLILFFSSV